MTTFKLLSVFIWFLLICGHSHGLLHDLADIIDLSNVDLANFEFFRNLPSQDPRTAAQANPFLEHFQRKKAVLDYIEHLFLGNSPFTQESEIPFNPYFGRAWRPHYQRKFGHRGERLIEMLGKGHSVRMLEKFGAISKHIRSSYFPMR